MPNGFAEHAPPMVHLSLLVGEAYGRLPVPLAGLPEDSGIGAFSVPRKRPDGTVVVPVDRKERFRPREADLIGTRPVEAFAPPLDVTIPELRWILETGLGRRWATVVKRFGERAWPVTQSLIRAGGVVARVDIADAKTWEPRSLSLTQAWAGQAEDRLREIRGLPVPSVARAALLDLLAGIPELQDEADLLADVPADASLLAVRGSRTRAGAWTTYDAGLQAASYWYRNQGDRMLTEREISAHMLGGSKKWTPEGKAAFQNVMGKPFDVLVDTIEQDILVRGPLRWTVGQVTANAATANPWIGLPSGGIHLVGEIEHQSCGVLVIENADVLKQVCLHAGISDRWLCVWGNGSVQDGIIAFLKLMYDIPIAVWGDLDAYGIQIIDSMARRLGRTVTPVGMSVALYTNGTKYAPKDLPDSLNVARKMVASGIESLRDLAQAIVATGGLGCEQETLYAKVLPVLAQQLATLERK